MDVTVSQLSPEDLKRLIRETVKEAIEEAVEDLVGLSSAGYLESIREAREDARAGRVVALEDLAGG